MKAMILAAGLGTRLRPLTDDRPKALVTVAGKTLLEIAIERLRAVGVDQIIVNAHYFADSIVDYLREHDNFGMQITVSRENHLLDTGGGLKKAAPFFLNSKADVAEPFILHNVDVISSIDLKHMMRQHRERSALATLAGQHRETSRYLLFDEQGQLCGRRAGLNGPPQLVRPVQTADALGFCGVHIVALRLLELMSESGAFSIIDAYLRLAAAGEKILAYQADGSYWRDVGKPENVAQVEQELERGAL